MREGAAPTPQDRGLRSHAELAPRHEHGTRMRYLGGCKCLPCRMANANYATMRIRAQQRGEGNGLVAATRVVAHLRALSAAGVGYKTAAARAGIATSVVADVLAGRRRQVRQQTEKALLAVTAGAAAPGAYIDAGPTWLLLEQLLRVFPKREIARRLGSTAKSPALQLARDRVTAENARKVAALHAESIAPRNVVHRLVDDEDEDESV